MSVIKTLYVGIAYPPKKDPECIQTGRILKYLSRSDQIQLEVITAKPPILNMPVDDTLSDFGIKTNRVYEKPIHENRYINYLKSKMRVFSFPDLKRQFWKGMIDFAIRNKVSNPDVIYARAYPVSSILAGYDLSIYFNVPLIVHFSDPWLLSPLHHYSKKGKDRIEEMEQGIFSKACAVTFTSEMTKEIYISRYPELTDKAYLQPNVFDESSVKDTNPSKTMDRKLRLVYTGGIVGNRNPKAIVEAIDQLDVNERENLEFIIAGDADTPNRQLLNELNHPQVKYLGLISFKEAMNLQSSAHLLVLFDNIFQNKKDAIYLPSKLLDYFVQKTKILAITTLGGTTHKVLKRTKVGVSFGHDQVNEIAAFLREALMQLELKNESFFSTSIVPSEFSASYNAKKLEKLILKYA